MKDGNKIYRVSQEEMLIFLEVIILVILSKIVYMYTYLIAKGCQSEFLKDGNNIYRVSQEEMLIFLEVIILVILSKIVYMYTYLKIGRASCRERV